MALASARCAEICQVSPPANEKTRVWKMRLRVRCGSEADIGAQEAHDRFGRAAYVGLTD
jgi:hypothetical protein